MKSFLAAFAATAFSMSVAAHDGMHGPGSEYDIDEDGALSVDEYKVYLEETKQDVSNAAALFAAADANKDGEVSSGEFSRASRSRPK